MDKRQKLLVLVNELCKAFFNCPRKNLQVMLFYETNCVGLGYEPDNVPNLTFGLRAKLEVLKIGSISEFLHHINPIGEQLKGKVSSIFEAEEKLKVIEFLSHQTENSM